MVSTLYSYLFPDTCPIKHHITPIIDRETEDAIQSQLDTIDKTIKSFEQLDWEGDWKGGDNFPNFENISNQLDTYLTTYKSVYAEKFVSEKKVIYKIFKEIGIF
jgi:hypothetical protein